MGLGNISAYFSAKNKKKARLNGCVYEFSIDYRVFDTFDIIDIHKYLMKKHNIKEFLIKKVFIGLLNSVVVNASSHTKCVSLSNQKCKIQPTLINPDTNKYSEELHYYPFTVKLDRSVESHSTLNDLSNKVCVPNKTEVLNLRMFNIITDINKSKILTKHISCECKYKFDGRKCNSNQKWNNDKCRFECKKHNIC